MLQISSKLQTIKKTNKIKEAGLPSLFFEAILFGFSSETCYDTLEKSSKGRYENL